MKNVFAHNSSAGAVATRSSSAQNPNGNIDVSSMAHLFSGDHLTAETISFLKANLQNINATSQYDSGAFLLAACAQDDVEQVRYLLESNISPVFRAKKDGMTPLICATIKGNLPIVKMLLAAKADVNDMEPGSAPVHEAATYHHVEILKLLLAAKANPNSCLRNEAKLTPIAIACKKDDVEVIKLLIESKAAAVGPSSWLASGESPFYLAAMFGSVKVVELLVKAKANLYHKHNSVGASVLHNACMSENVELVEKLFELGFEPDTPDNEWRTSLTVVAQTGNGKIAALLIAAKADVNGYLPTVRQNSVTPFHTAVMNNYIELAAFLVSKGARSFCPGNCGKCRLQMTRVRKWLDRKEQREKLGLEQEAKAKVMAKAAEKEKQKHLLQEGECGVDVANAHADADADGYEEEETFPDFLAELTKVKEELAAYEQSKSRGGGGKKVVGDAKNTSPCATATAEATTELDDWEDDVGPAVGGGGGKSKKQNKKKKKKR